MYLLPPDSAEAVIGVGCEIVADFSVIIVGSIRAKITDAVDGAAVYASSMLIPVVGEKSAFAVNAPIYVLAK